MTRLPRQGKGFSWTTVSPQGDEQTSAIPVPVRWRFLGAFIPGLPGMNAPLPPRPPGDDPSRNALLGECALAAFGPWAELPLNPGNRLK